MIEHVPGYRKVDDILPVVILITGKSGIGKSTVSHLLNKSENVKYFSLDEFTVDSNIPIEVLVTHVKNMGKNAIKNIPKFEKYVIKYKDIFISYCFENAQKFEHDIFVFDGVYFNDKNFLESFKKKFKKKYKIWTMSTDF
jgi:predicted ATPase